MRLVVVVAMMLLIAWPALATRRATGESGARSGRAPVGIAVSRCKSITCWSRHSGGTYSRRIWTQSLH